MIEILFYYIKTSLIVMYFVLSIGIILHLSSFNIALNVRWKLSSPGLDLLLCLSLLLPSSTCQSTCPGLDPFPRCRTRPYRSWQTDCSWLFFYVFFLIIFYFEHVDYYWWYFVVLVLWFKFCLIIYWLNFLIYFWLG